MSRSPTMPRGPLLGLVALVLLIVVGYLAGAGGDEPAGGTPGSISISSSVGTGTSRAPGSVGSGGTVDAADLPPEGRETLDLIAAGGPFPYDQDGQTFGNREGLLPPEPGGYYREYTVDTPGSDDRGARRLIVGGQDEIFYTDDHYESFRLVTGR